MLNETGVGAGGDSNGRTIGDVVLVGRSWFRMTSGDDEGTPVPLSTQKTARIGIDRRRLGVERRLAPERRSTSAPIALAAPTEAQPVEWDADAEMPRRTVTVPWWLVGVVGAVLMASGAAAAAMLKLRPAPVLSAVPVPPAAPAPSPARPAAPVIVEPLATPPSPPLEATPVAEPAPVARPAPAVRAARPTATAMVPARRAPPSPAKRSAETAAPRSKVWVDPFAE